MAKATKPQPTTQPAPAAFDDAITAALPAERPPARLIEAVVSEPAALLSARERALAGIYRVIHSNYVIGIPLERRCYPDGTPNPMMPSTVTVGPGSIVELDDFDAASGLDNDLIEPATVPLAASRMNKVWNEAERSKKPWTYAECEKLRLARDEAIRRAAARK